MGTFVRRQLPVMGLDPLSVKPYTEVAEIVRLRGGRVGGGPEVVGLDPSFLNQILKSLFVNFQALAKHD